MLPKYRPEDLCGDLEWQQPHLFAWRIGRGGREERRCEFCGMADPRDRPALPSLGPAFGTAAALMVICAVMPRIATLLERIAIALEAR